jgi:hypothetical protein
MFCFIEAYGYHYGGGLQIQNEQVFLLWVPWKSIVAVYCYKSMESRQVQLLLLGLYVHH